jgi:hypothetical protein
MGLRSRRLVYVRAGVGRSWDAMADGLTLVALTALVWGLYPFARGIRFASDDLNFLFVAWRHAGEPLIQQLLLRYPVDGGTRALAFWPFMVAIHLPGPAVFLQLFYGIVWLLNGVAVACLARVLWPASRLAPFIAGCLTVTATSDFLTDSVVYGPHLLGVALFFLGTAQLLRCAEWPEGTGRAIVAALLLGWSFFTVEYTYPTVPFLPVLVWLHARTGWSLRWWRALLALSLAFIPAAVVLARDLLRPGSRAIAVLLPTCSLPPHCSPLEWLAVLGKHLVHNFWPIAWAFRPIPPWYDNYPSVFPSIVCGAVATLGLLLGWWRFRRHARDVAAEAPLPPSGPLALVTVLVAAMVAANAASANLGGDYFVRSHFVSRAWASLALAVLLTRAGRLRRGRVVSAAVLAVFVFFGVWGGVERQGYLLSYAVNERREVASLLEAVPGFRLPSRLVVIQPPGSPTMIALSNPNAIPFMYGDGMRGNDSAMAPNWAAEKVEGDGSGRIRLTASSSRDAWVDPARCILVFFSISQRRFIRLDHVPAGLLRGSGDAATNYQPAQWLGTATEGMPAAIQEFLARGDSAFSDRALLRSRRYAKTLARTPSVTIFSIGPSVVGRVQVDSLAPYGVSSQGREHWSWLGAGRPEGYSSMLWARQAVAGTLDIHVAPVPDGRESARWLVARLSQGESTAHTFKAQFDSDVRITHEIQLSAGANLLEIWLEETDAGIVRGTEKNRRPLGKLYGIHLG